MMMSFRLWWSTVLTPCHPCRASISMPCIPAPCHRAGRDVVSVIRYRLAVWTSEPAFSVEFKLTLDTCSLSYDATFPIFIISEKDKFKKTLIPLLLKDCRSSINLFDVIEVIDDVTGQENVRWPCLTWVLEGYIFFFPVISALRRARETTIWE